MKRRKARKTKKSSWIETRGSFRIGDIKPLSWGKGSLPAGFGEESGCQDCRMLCDAISVHNNDLKQSIEEAQTVMGQHGESLIATPREMGILLRANEDFVQAHKACVSGDYDTALRLYHKSASLGTMLWGKILGTTQAYWDLKKGRMKVREGGE